MKQKFFYQKPVYHYFFLFSGFIFFILSIWIEKYRGQLLWTGLLLWFFKLLMEWARKKKGNNY
jgi:hypothetical protein